jgi:hypothetical protein
MFDVEELKMDVVGSSEMLLPIHQTARNHIAEEPDGRNSVLPKPANFPEPSYPGTSEMLVTIY